MEETMMDNIGDLMVEVSEQLNDAHKTASLFI